MVFLSSTLFFTIPTLNAKPFLANNIKEEANIEMVHKDIFGLLINPVQEQYEKDKLESNRIKNEKIKQDELEKQKDIENSHERTFIVSYYGATESECGNSHFITSSGIPVQEGHIAVPKEIPFRSKVIINGVEYLATDRGNPRYICILDNNDIRVDIFVPRLNSEINSDYKYEKRIAKMGIKKVVGKLYLKE